MQWVMIILLGIAANLDNLGMRVAYGIQKTRIPFRSNSTIAFISMGITYAAMIAGDSITAFISIRTADVLGGLLLCGIGVWMFCRPKFQKAHPFEDASVADMDGNRIISIREAIPLGFVLAANCLATGFGMGVSGSSVIGTILSVGAFSFLTIGVSHHVGQRLANTWIGRFPEAIAGGVLMVIGCVELFG